jgi:hypothetical protein
MVLTRIEPDPSGKRAFNCPGCDEAVISVVKYTLPRRCRQVEHDFIIWVRIALFVLFAAVAAYVSSRLFKTIREGLQSGRSPACRNVFGTPTF